MNGTKGKRQWLRYTIGDPGTHPATLQLVEVECKNGRRDVCRFGCPGGFISFVDCVNPPLEQDFLRWRPELEGT